MSTDHVRKQTWPSEPILPGRALGVALAMAAFVGAFFPLREQWGHLAGYWPYFLLLSCPVLHLFHGHGGHGRYGHDDEDAARTTNRDA